ncbi:MAG: hypothetical protein U0640_03670 [Phycisphaerales bacterium]
MKFASSNATLLARLSIAGVLASCGSVWAQTPTVTQIGLLPGDTAITPVVNAQQDHVIARGSLPNGDAVYLVVWADWRSQQVGGGTNQSQGDIYGIRLDANGQPIDSASFAICSRYGEQRSPRVAWNGENFMVVFTSQDATGGYFADQLRGVRVSPQGQVLDTTPITFPASQFDPSTIGLQIAGLNGQWLVTRCVYHNDGYGTYLAGQRINGQGQLIDTSPLMLNDWVYGQTKLLVNNGEYLAVGPDWNDSAVTKARRINASAQPIGASFNLPGSNIASNGTGEYYVTWTRAFVDLVGSRVTSTGTLLTPSGTTLVSNINPYAIPNVTHDGQRWWMEWEDPAGQHTMRIAANGNVVDPGGTLFTSPMSVYRNFIGKANGQGAMFGWWESTLNDSDVHVTPVDVNGQAQPSSVVSIGSNTQRSASIAIGNSGQRAVAFISENANEGKVLVHFLNSDGTPSTTEPIMVASSPTVGRTSIAWNGSVYLVTWDTGTNIMARRMHANGTFPEDAFQVMQGFSPDVEATGEDFLIACAKFSTNPQFINAWMSIIDGPSGTIQTNPALIGGGYVNAGPNVSSDGNRWIVTYQSQWTHNSSQVDMAYNFVEPNGAFTTSNNPLLTSGASGTPDVAYGNGKYLFVWRNNSLANANNFIAGRIMNADGSFATGHFTIAEATGRQLRPVVSFDGTNFVVAWDDQRHQAFFFDNTTDVYAARVSPTGTVLDTVPMQVSRIVGGDAVASIASDAGVTYFANSRMIDALPLDTYRITLARIGTPQTVCNDIDFNNDGSLFDLMDIDAFLSTYSEGPCVPETATCDDIDFNNDTSVFDPCDINSFLLVYSEGPCTPCGV